MARARQRLTATIANGAALSDAVELGAYEPLAVVMPAAWTAAGLSFQASFDGAAYVDVHDAAGELTTAAGASRAIALDPDKFLGARKLKIRSGTAAAAVNQLAERKLTVIVGGR
jgi:hypothetical protein